MGSLLSLFRRAVTPAEILDGINKEIQKVQERQASRQKRRRRIGRGVMLAFFVLTALVGVSAYLRHKSGELYDGTKRRTTVLQIGLLVALPVALLMSSRVFQALFDMMDRRDERKLKALNGRKRAKIEQLKRESSYEYVSKLIQQYEREDPPAAAKAIPQAKPSVQKEASTPQTPKGSSTAARTVALRASASREVPTPTVLSSSNSPVQLLSPQARTAMDKVVDFVIGDGPNNRFALICKSCSFHNGLVREEDLDTIRYRCAACNFLNGSTLNSSSAKDATARNLRREFSQSADLKDTRDEDKQVAVDQAVAGEEADAGGEPGVRRRSKRRA